MQLLCFIGIIFSFLTCSAQPKTRIMPPLYFKFITEDPLTSFKRTAIKEVANEWNIEVIETPIVESEHQYNGIMYRAGRPGSYAYDGVHPDTEHEQYQKKFGKNYLLKFAKEVQEKWSNTIIDTFIHRTKKDFMFGNGLSATIATPANENDALEKGFKTMHPDKIDMNNYSYVIYKSKVAYLGPDPGEKHHLILFKIYTKGMENQTTNHLIALYKQEKENEYYFRIYDCFYKN